MKPAEWVEVLRYLALIASIGLIIAISVWLGWLLGSALENLLGSFFWQVAGLIMGIAGGFVTIYSTLKKIIPWE